MTAAVVCKVGCLAAVLAGLRDLPRFSKRVGLCFASGAGLFVCVSAVGEGENWVALS